MFSFCCAESVDEKVRMERIEIKTVGRVIVLFHRVFEMRFKPWNKDYNTPTAEVVSPSESVRELPHIIAAWDRGLQEL